MRPFRTALFAAAVCAGTAGAAAAWQDPFADKTADELIDYAKRKIAEREAETATNAQWDEFVPEARKRFGNRFNRVVRVWKNDPGRGLQPVIALGRIYRSYGDTRTAIKQFETALRKAQDNYTKWLCHLEQARVYQLTDNDRAARQQLLKASSVLKNVNNQQEAQRLADMGQAMREYQQLLDARKDNPSDWRTHWKVCDHLLRFRDQEQLHYLVVDTLVALDWLRVAFPNSPGSKDGGVHWFMLEVAAGARDVETAIEAADRLWALGDENSHNKTGETVLSMAKVLRQDDGTRQQALHCYRFLQAQRPNHPAVTSGQVSKDIQEVERMRGVRREPSDAPIPNPPWAP